MDHCLAEGADYTQCGTARGDRSQSTHAVDRAEILIFERISRSVVASGSVGQDLTRPAPELDDERRRYYRLTPQGRKVLKAEPQRLAQAAQLAELKHVLDESG